MKKILLFFCVIAFIFSASPISSMAENTSVYCNGSPLWFAEGPYIIDGNTFVHATGLSSAFAYTYHWDAATSSISMFSPSASAYIQANNPYITVTKNNYTYTMFLSAVPRIINGKFFVPLRTLAEIFEYSVAWNPVVGAASVNSLSYTNGQIESSDISVASFTPPQSISIGSSYILSGTVSSAFGINRLNVKVIDTNTGVAEINETEFNINSLNYNLNSIDSRIRFGGLSIGSKTLQFTVVNGFEGRKVFSYPFIVNRPEVPQTIITPESGNSAQFSADPNAPMLWPVPSSGIVTTIFWCDNPECHSNSGKESGHGAIDISANEGASVIAVMDGVVESQGFGDGENQQTGYGNYIRIDHGNGYITQYSHLYSIYVTDGQKVNAGQIIGGVGNTGKSTGNHLDFFILKDGVRVDPLRYLTPHPNIRCWEDCDLPFFNEALREKGYIR